MATPNEVLALRNMVAEPLDESPWTTDVLAGIIDGAASLNAAAAEVWRRKAALAADLVDVTEGTSSRKLGNLHKNALEMADMYDNLVAEALVSNAPRTRAIVRP